LCFSNFAYSQSVDSLINEALQNNPQLKALQSRIKSAEYKSESVSYLPPPELGLEFNQIPIKEYNLWNEPLSQTLSISQMFPLGGKLRAMENVERKNIDISKTDYESFKLKLISQVRKLYYDIWLRKHHMELREDVISLLENVYKSTESLYEVGKAGYSNLLLIQAEVATNKTEKEIINNKIRSTLFELNSLIGRKIDDKEIIVDHQLMIDTSAFIPEELEKDLLELNPSLAKMERMIEMNQLEIESVNRELIPDLMLSGMLMRMPRGMFLTTKTDPMMITGNGETEIMYGLMASITLPFAPWSSGKYSAKEEELLNSISGIRSEKENMQREMTAELNVLINELQSAREEIKLLSGEVIPLYRKTIEAQVIEFQNNRLSISSLLETIRMLLMKEEESAEVEAKHQMLLAEIEALVGSKIE